MAELAALILSSTLFGFEFIALFLTDNDSWIRILIIGLINTLVYLALFVRNKGKMRRGCTNDEHYSGLKKFCLLCFLFLLSFVFVKYFWDSHYLSLDPYITFFDVKSHIDTLLHSTIAQSIKNYGIPSILVENNSPLSYHYGSHYLFAWISELTGISVFSVMNFIYPVVFAPLFIFLLFRITRQVKIFTNQENRENGIADILFIIIAFIGLYPESITDVWLSSLFGVSESFFCSILFFLVFINISFSLINRKKDNRHLLKYLYAILLVPAFIFLCTSMKISVGLLLSIGASFVFFQTEKKIPLKLFFPAYYMAIYFVVYGLFSETTIACTKFSPFGFYRRYVDNIILYIFVVYLPYILFIGSRFFENKEISVKSLFSKNFICEQTITLIAAVGALPGILLNIGGGSAFYFNIIQYPLCIILVIGYGIPDRVFNSLKEGCKTLNIPARCFMLVVSFSVISFSLQNVLTFEPLKNAIQSRKGLDVEARSIKHQLDMINSFTQKVAKSACIVYARPDFPLFDTAYPKKAIFILPSYTGLVTINTISVKDNALYAISYDDKNRIGPITEELGYGLDRPFLHTAKFMDIEEAKIMASKKGYQYLIEVGNSTVVHDLSKNESYTL